VTDRGDWLAARHEGLDEGDRVAVDAQRVGIHGPAWKQQRVIVIHQRVGDQPVNRKGGRGDHVELPGLDLTRRLTADLTQQGNSTA